MWPDNRHGPLNGQGHRPVRKAGRHAVTVALELREPFGADRSGRLAWYARRSHRTARPAASGWAARHALLGIESAFAFDQGRPDFVLEPAVRHN